MSTVLETHTLNGLTCEIVADHSPESPRVMTEPSSQLTCWHRRYTLGDPHVFRRPADFLEWWMEEGKNGLLVPVYLYDHGGIAMSTKPFSCPWDSGQVGWAAMTAAELDTEFPGEPRDVMQIKGRALIDAEVATYDMYLRGDVYGFRLIDVDGDLIDSCYGFYGEKAVMDAARDAARCFAHHPGARPATDGSHAHG